MMCALKAVRLELNLEITRAAAGQRIMRAAVVRDDSVLFAFEAVWGQFDEGRNMGYCSGMTAELVGEYSEGRNRWKTHEETNYAKGSPSLWLLFRFTCERISEAEGEYPPSLDWQRPHIAKDNWAVHREMYAQAPGPSEETSQSEDRHQKRY
jgi:hypothetical protein